MPEVELVIVPAFGDEWNKDELRALIKSGKRAAKSEARSGKINAWVRVKQGVSHSVLFTVTCVALAPHNPIHFPVLCLGCLPARRSHHIVRLDEP